MQEKIVILSIEYPFKTSDVYKGFWSAWRKPLLLCLLAYILWIYTPYYRKNLWFILMYQVPVRIEISLYIMRWFFWWLGFFGVYGPVYFLISLFNIWISCGKIKGDPGTVSVAIKDDGFNVSLQGVQMFVAWKDIDQVKRDDGYMYIRSQKLFTDLKLRIPEVVFPSKEDANQFFTVASQSHLEACKK